MKTTRKDMQKQVLMLLGILVFAFINVFIFDDKLGIGFSAFSTISLMTIGLLSKRWTLRLLALLSYLINIVAAIFGFTYIGFLTAVQAIELIFVIWYLYPRDHFFRRDTTDKYTYRYRWIHLILTVLISVAAYIGFAIVSRLWDGSFLEYGGNTALIFAMQYLLYLSLEKSRKNEALKIAHYYQAEKRARESREAIKAQREAQLLAAGKPVEPSHQKSQSQDFLGSNVVKFASVWLLVMDMSILAYFLRPNDVGFAFGAFFVLLTIVLSLIIKTEEDKEDVFSIIYHKIRPVQPIFFILLLIAHAHKFSYGAAYALIFSVAYFFWAINKINMKTLLTLTVLIYFFPGLGYLSNPYRLGAENLSMVGELVGDRGHANTFHIGDYYNLLGIGSDDEYEAVPVKWRVARFTDSVSLSKDYTASSGIWTEDDYDFYLEYDSRKDAIRVTDTSPEKKDKSVYFDHFDRIYDRYHSLSKQDNDNRYKDYYRLGDVTTDNGSYSIFIKMDDDWVKEYKEDPDDVDYDFLIFGDRKTAKEAYQSQISD